MAGAGCVRAGGEPGQAVGDRVHRDEQFGGEPELGQIVHHRAGHEIDERRAQLGPDVALGRFLDRHRFGQPRGREILPECGQFGGERVVGPEVGRREHALELFAGRGPVPTEREVPAGRGRQHVVRIATQRTDGVAGECEDLRRHQAEQVRSGRVLEPGDAVEALLGARCAAQHRIPFADHHVETRAGEHGGGDEAVVAAADDHYVVHVSSHLCVSGRTFVHHSIPATGFGFRWR